MVLDKTCLYIIDGLTLINIFSVHDTKVISKSSLTHLGVAICFDILQNKMEW